MSKEHEYALQDVITELVGAGFLQPLPVMMSLRAWSLLLPSIAQAIGLCCFGVVAWSFTEMSQLGADYRTNLVVIGSFLIAAGGSIGSLPVTVELFRKRHNGGWAWFDWATNVFSPIASLVETVTALSFLGGFEISQSRSRIVLLAVLGTLDTCLGMAELGDYLGMFDQRLEQWKREYKKAVRDYYNRGQIEQSVDEVPVPTGEYAYTKPLPPAEPQNNGNSGYCFCGHYCTSPQAYAAHFKAKHMEETVYDPATGDKYGAAPVALRAMEERYKETKDNARWNFPSLERVVEMRRKVR